MSERNDDELPGMWSHADFEYGATDAAEASRLAFLALFAGTIKHVLDSAPPDADVIHIAITRSYAERLIKQVP